MLEGGDRRVSGKEKGGSRRDGRGREGGKKNLLDGNEAQGIDSVVYWGSISSRG